MAVSDRERPRSRQRWIQTPALHFLFLGGLLFTASSLWRTHAGNPEGPGEPRVLVVTAERIRQLSDEHQRQWERWPSRVELEAMVNQTVDDDLLELEARRLALDHGDRSIRQRLVQKMRAVNGETSPSEASLGEAQLYRAAFDLGFDDDLVIRRHLRQKMRLLLEREPGAEAPTQEELLEALERHRDRFLQPPTLSFSHVYISRSRHGEQVGSRAATVAARIQSQLMGPEAATALSDPFPLAMTWRAQSQEAIARQFGEDFAERLQTLPLKAWSEPIESPFGQHLVWLHDRSSESLPPLSEVRRQLQHLISEERAAIRLARGLAQLRQLYQIRIEWPAELPTSETVSSALGS